MKEKLNLIILEETKSLKSLLNLLDEQFEYINKNNVFALEGIVKKIKNQNAHIAKWEMERRKLTGKRAMSEVIASFKDKEIEENYIKIKNLLEEVKLQKDTNEALIRQSLGFATRMLTLLNPDRTPKTYGPKGLR